MSQLPHSEIGTPFPLGNEHAIISSMPRWALLQGFITNDPEVMQHLKIDYPRFIIHRQVRELRKTILSRYATELDDCFPFTSAASARRCVEWMTKHNETKHTSCVRVVEIGPYSAKAATMSFDETLTRWTTFFVVVFRKEDYMIAYQFWMHRGVGLSSRNTEFVLPLLDAGVLIAQGEESKKLDEEEKVQVVPLLPVLPDARTEKEELRKRIAGLASLDHEHNPIKPEDVFLYQAGMSAIFHSHDALIEAYSENQTRLFAQIGFPYLDTMYMLDKWGPGVVFYGHATTEEIDDFELRLKKGERFATLYLEAPGNPLCQTPDFGRLKKLSLEYGFPIVIDDTIGSWANVDALKFADIAATSLSKAFSGYCDVLGGCLVLNPDSPHYPVLKATLNRHYEDDYFPLDAIVLERNSRDYVPRVKNMSSNAEALADFLSVHPMVSKVSFPKFTTRENFDQIRRPGGKFGMLMSVFFNTKEDASVFFDNLETVKGGSLGTNFTLSIPYTVMAFGKSEKAVAHAREYGVVEESIRVSAGIEDIEEIKAIFARALEKVVEAKHESSRL